MVRKFVVLFLIVAFSLSTAKAQEKTENKTKNPNTPKKKTADQAKLTEQMTRLKRQISLLKKQNALFQRRVRTYQFILKLYRKKMARNPMQTLKSRLQFLLRQIKYAFMKRGFRGVFQVLRKFFRDVKRMRYRMKNRRTMRKRVIRRPRRIYKRSGTKKVYPKVVEKGWLTSLKEAKALALKTKKPILVKFGASW